MQAGVDPWISTAFVRVLFISAPLRVEAGDVLEGSSQISQRGGAEGGCLTCFIYTYLQTMKSKQAQENQFPKEKTTLLN